MGVPPTIASLLAQARTASGICDKRVLSFVVVAGNS
jgi:hypothetical protein